MNYTRLFSDSSGSTHFEDLDMAVNEADYRPPAPSLYVSHAFEAGGLQFVRLPSGWTGEHIKPPKRQFLIGIKGHLEVTASDGERRSFGPGDCVLMEDMEGRGHRSHVRAGHDCVVAVVPVD